MSRGEHVVALLEKRGRFLVAQPFFPSRDSGSPASRGGQRLTVERDRKAGPGDLVLLRTAGQGKGRAKIVRKLGQPDVARDVIGALMLDRGHLQGFADRVVSEARDAAAAAPGRDVARKDLRDLPTFTIDPVTAADFDDAISAEELGRAGGACTSTSPTSAPTCARPGRWTARPTGARRASTSRAPSSRCCRPSSPPTRARWSPRQDRLAVTAELGSAAR